MAANQLDKPKGQDDECDQFIFPFSYHNDLPEVEVDCKFLPCGTDILECTEEPVSFRSLESQFEHQFKGMHLLLDVNLVNPSVYDEPPQQDNILAKRARKMHPKDAALLADIEPLHCGGANERPSRVQECAQMFPKERIVAPRQRRGVYRALPAAEPPTNLQSVSLEQQIEIIDQTFMQINKPLGSHPFKPKSNVRPVSVLPIFPDTDLHNYTFLQIRFDNPPTCKNKSLLKDLGNYIINFEAKQMNPLTGECIYESEQRYKEDKSTDIAEKCDRIILIEKPDAYYYANVNKHIKLRRERPRPQATVSKFQLLVKPIPKEAK